MSSAILKRQQAEVENRSIRLRKTGIHPNLQSA